LIYLFYTKVTNMVIVQIIVVAPGECNM